MGTGRSPSGQKPTTGSHLMDTVGEGLLLRTKDPLLGLPNWGASGGWREGPGHGHTPPGPPGTHSGHRCARKLAQPTGCPPGGFAPKTSEGPVLRRLCVVSEPRRTGSRGSVCRVVVSVFTEGPLPQFSPQEPAPGAHTAPTRAPPPTALAPRGPRVQTHR